MSNIIWKERSSNSTYLRPRLDGVLQDVTLGTWTFFVKPVAAVAADDDDTSAVVTLTVGDGLEIVDDPDDTSDPPRKILLASVGPDDTPDVGVWSARLDREDQPGQDRTPFGPVPLGVEGI